MPSETLLVYTKAPDATGACRFCDQVKAWLQEKAIPYAEAPLNPKERQVIYDRLGLEGDQRTVPQVLVIIAEGDEVRIGGHAEVTSSRVETLFLKDAPNRHQQPEYAKRPALDKAAWKALEEISRAQPSYPFLWREISMRKLAAHGLVMRYPGYARGYKITQLGMAKLVERNLQAAGPCPTPS